jgi:dinuclear metal center YbgI/SA1388 family protein
MLMMTTRQDMLQAFDALLQPERFKDYGPNGLQVEGRSEIRRIVSGVTASRALIEAAIEAGADAIFVHHGLFWRGMDGRITGWLKERIRLLLAHDINLFAYHLPLDAHAELGNNAQLVRGWACRAGRIRRSEPGLAGRCGLCRCRCSGRTCARRAGAQGDAGRCARAQADSQAGLVHRRAQGFFESAIAAGADAYITGEISEPQMHLAREMGVSFIAAGHHATERYGAPAVAAHVAQECGLEHRFIDIDNPA